MQIINEMLNLGKYLLCGHKTLFIVSLIGIKRKKKKKKNIESIIQYLHIYNVCVEKQY